MAEQRTRARPRGRHLLAPRLAADLVRNAGITRGDLVVEIGAGTGLITRELAGRARQVVAIELDPAFARKLRHRFAHDRHVQVVEADAHEVALPPDPFRVVANLPFAHTTELLHRLLDDPTTPLSRADVVVAWGFAAKRCSQRPSTMLTVSWAPWFEFTISRRLPASGFRPPPSTDAAVMTITRRHDPLLEPTAAAPFRRFLQRAYGRHPRPSELDAWDWTQRFEVEGLSRGGARRGARRRRPNGSARAR